MCVLWFIYTDIYLSIHDVMDGDLQMRIKKEIFKRLVHLFCLYLHLVYPYLPQICFICTFAYLYSYMFYLYRALCLPSICFIYTSIKLYQTIPYYIHSATYLRVPAKATYLTIRTLQL